MSPGHYPYNSEAFLERVKVKPCSSSPFPPRRGPGGTGMLQWAHNPGWLPARGRCKPATVCNFCYTSSTLGHPRDPRAAACSFFGDSQGFVKKNKKSQPGDLQPRQRCSALLSVAVTSSQVTEKPQSPPRTQHMKRLLPPLLFGSLSLTFPCLPPHVWDRQFLPFLFDSILEQ